jgi:hypothetical protein
MQKLLSEWYFTGLLVADTLNLGAKAMTTARFTQGLAAGAAVLTIGVLAHAQTFMAKPGLWEITTTTKMSGMPQIPMPDLSQVPPDQRARVEAMMNGMQGRGAMPPTTTRECMTQEKLDRQMFTDKRADRENCKQTVVSKTATTREMKIECTGEDAMNGTLKITASDPQNVKGEMAMNLTGGRGAGATVNSTFTAKWLGADCGDVK